MNRILISVAATMALGSVAEAKQRHMLHGLFCNTEAQIEQTLTYMRHDLPPQMAVEIANKHEVACVFVERIHYVVTNPVMIGQARLHGGLLMKYEATLVGVLVGGNLRPVEPPMQTYFVSGNPLLSAAVKSDI